MPFFLFVAIPNGLAALEGRHNRNELISAMRCSRTCALAVTLATSCVAACVPFDGPHSNAAGNSVELSIRSPDAPVLIAMIGDAKVPLWLDLGDSTPLTLQKSVLDAAHATPTGETITLQGIDGKFEVPLYTVPRVQIGAAVFTNVTAKLDAARAGYEVSQTEGGVLGSGLLKAGALVLDYPHRRMILLSRNRAENNLLCRGTTVPFSTASDSWKGEAVTEATTDFGRVILWWDTGAQATLVTRSVSHASDHIVSQHFVLGDRNFGPWTIGLLDAALPGFDGAIGDDFFAKHQVCIDYPHSRVIVHN